MKGKFKKTEAFKVGDEIKWDHRSWHKVLKVSVVGGWVYFQLEGFQGGCTIWHDIERPWR